LLSPEQERSLARRFRRAVDSLRRIAKSLQSSDLGDALAQQGLDLHDADSWSVPATELFAEIVTRSERSRKSRLRSKVIGQIRRWQLELTTTREALTVANLRLVAHVARKQRNSIVPLLDLIQEGNLGLLQAIDRFDPEVGVKLSTYAYFWIRQSIDRAVAKQGDLIVKPYDRHRRRMQVAAAIRSMLRELGRRPTVEELANRLRIPERRVEEALSRELDVKSLDELATDNSGRKLADRVEDRSSTLPEERFLEKELVAGIHRALEELLTERERRIVVLRFGLDGDGMRTLEDVGQAVGLSRERVRQIEVRASKKLRESDVLAELYGTLGAS
jgi:RNA polymerase primary sigma factor